MFTTGTQVMTSPGGQKMMTHESAEKVAETFKLLGGFTKVECMERGYDSGCWCVELWLVNAKAGNRNLYTVCHTPATEKEYKLIRKTALGKANERDAAALARIAAERELNRE